ncbi:undecaprenyl-diphosphatase [Clostridium magnum]|uniref:Undecaprenyl-diphosphatase BcrC n=1 Tax=Clostridium magnum DSM 2767 TaxID=1121326 RepID=A0A162SQ99_9CLOT|nr:undecaprenyl-diphosphatase [Clostridium magnum]KZL91729.1 undecaprenyl-diphosphatase BcrC [Clostridium magnum DSM 2767]SHJ04025.1 undecaprenyl-diphosphatase [Clostridium magnum DSM 2767]
MNMELFRLINNLANKNTVLDKIMIFFSKDVPYIFMAVIALVFILGVIKKKEEYRKVSVNTFVITVINLILSFIIGSIYYVDRPFVHNKVNLLIAHSADASFPSDHATGTMSIALGLGKSNRILGVIMTILSLIVGFSRVYVGNHYPLDVISAYIIVFITNYLYNLVLKNKIEELYTKIERLLISKLEFDKNILNN